MKAPKPHFRTAADLYGTWRDDLLSGTAPVLYKVGTDELSQIEIGPQLVTIIGGAPGAGKTAFTMQCVVDALRLNDSLRVLICNVEMPASVLLDRQLARLSGIDLRDIRHRRLTEAHANRLDQALNTLEHFSERLCFVQPPFNLENVAASADAFDVNLLLLDYIQRIPPPGQHGDKRGSVDATMSFLRQFADAGVAVMVVTALARQKDNRGRSTYDGDSLNLASFRESSELEFGADDAFILYPDKKLVDQVHLKHLKARHTEPRDLQLRFDRPHQSFSSLGTTGSPLERDLGTHSASPELWEQAAPASDDLEGDLSW